MSQLVSRLLQFAKPSEYAGANDYYEVQSAVSDTIPLVHHLLKKTAVVLTREDHATRLTGMNRGELQQVLVNLITNAIHAMPNGGRLTLRTADRDSDGCPGLAIEIGDTGTGIAPDVLRRVLDPFFTTKGREGTGLGLSICQMLVNRHGGKLSIDSEVGQGTTFTVWFPEAR